ncbi:MAG: hypothetical protein NZ920_02275 [Aigarchaeota archaeon]|nr:hypothetical protein [Aigarchaeota archaeon]MDW8092548.1 hypothetical protein [Nitrososphaerota archaeon]
MGDTLNVLAVIVTAWATLLMLLAFISNTILPLIEGTSPFITGLLRVTVSVSLFIAWLAWWFALSKFLVYRGILRLMRARGENGKNTNSSSPH